MKRLPNVLGICLLLAGCGGSPEPPAGPPAGKVRLGMTPEQARQALGVPDFTAMNSADGTRLDIQWTYAKRRPVILEGEGPDRTFKGAILSFGGDGRRLTAVSPQEIPLHRPPPAPPPAEDPGPREAVALPPLPPELARGRAEALMTVPDTDLQAAVDRVMVRFPDCLPFLVGVLDRPDQALPDDRIFIPAPPGAPAGRLRRSRPGTRLGLVLDLLNQGTGQHFGVPGKPEDVPAIAVKWKVWFAAQKP